MENATLIDLLKQMAERLKVLHECDEIYCEINPKNIEIFIFQGDKQIEVSIENF